LFFFPKPASARLAVRPTGTTARTLSLPLQERGYLLEHDDANAVILTRNLDSTIVEAIHKGARAIAFLDDSSSLPPDSVIAVKSRKGSELDGRWFSNLNWIRTDSPVFRRLAFARFLGFESEHVAPRHVMTGLAAPQFDSVLSGITYAWLSRNCALMLEAHIGPGKVILTTFRFDAYGRDPYCTTLLDEMIRYVSSDSCKPRLNLRPDPTNDLKEPVEQAAQG
jgi:hypothetical protein